MTTTHRAMWFSLVLLALGWGFLSGVSFTRDIWLAPTTALFGMLAIVVLALTVSQMGKQSPAADTATL